MNTTTYNRIVSFIWSIADDCLRDVYVRGKYRDVILPMTVLRRFDALLEPTKDIVQQEVERQQGLFGKELIDIATLQKITGYNFYNTTKWTLERLQQTATNDNDKLCTNFVEYLDGFSENVNEIFKCFNLRRQIEHMAQKDVLLEVIQKFVSNEINLTPHDNTHNGKVLPGLSNLGMGYVFEELIRKFNEENNEEAGEHFTPREVIELMTTIVFEPVKDSLENVFTVYDPACGSGGMLTETQNFLTDPEGSIVFTGAIELYGKEVNDETYAICKSDILIKGNEDSNIRSGSTLSTDEFHGRTFNFMLSNPPYGKSWASETKYILDGKNVQDSRFVVELPDYWGSLHEEAATPRTSDGQLLFLMEMVSKMKPVQYGGSHIASVHNGSSLFTGDAGGGESTIRRYIIENDMLDCIVQLPKNIFYNTGITTYIWFLSNNKPANRKGKVILIDATERYQKLRKNLGAKNCELSKEHIREIMEVYQNFTDVERTTPDGIAAKVFYNSDFGYFDVTIERPKRLKGQFSEERIATLKYDKKLRIEMQRCEQEFGERLHEDLFALKDAIKKLCGEEFPELKSSDIEKLLKPLLWKKHRELYTLGMELLRRIGTEEYIDGNILKKQIDKEAKSYAKEATSMKVSASQTKAIFEAVTWYDESAKPMIHKTHTFSDDELAALCQRCKTTPEHLALFGYYATGKTNQFIEYQAETSLRDKEQIPFSDTPEAIAEYVRREVAPHVPEAWINIERTVIGYEISFNKYFYQHTPLRSLADVTNDILALEHESEGLIQELFGK